MYRRTETDKNREQSTGKTHNVGVVAHLGHPHAEPT